MKVQLTNMMDDAPSWCGNGCELREVPPEYFVERESERDTLPRSDAPHAPRC